MSEPTADLSAAARESGAVKKRRDPFAERKDAWLGRARSHPDLTDSAFRILAYVSDHASVREQGCSWFSHRRIADELKKSIPAVKRGLQNAQAVDLIRIVEQRDRGATNRYWPVLDGAPLAGELPAEIGSAKPAAQSGGGSKMSDPPGSKMNSPRPSKFEQPPGSNLNGGVGQKRPTTFLRDLPNRPASATTMSSPDRRPEVSEDEDQKIIAEIAHLHGQQLTPNLAKQWSVDLIKFRGRGIDPRKHLLPAVQKAVISRELTPTTTLFGRFEKAATEMRESFDVQSDEMVEHWLRLFVKDTAVAIASRQPHRTPPKRVHLKRPWLKQLQADLWPFRRDDEPSGWLRGEVHALLADGLSVDEIAAAVKRAAAAGVVPRDPEALKARGGGLRPLIEPHIECPRPPSSVH